MMQFIHLLLLVVGLMCAAITSRAQSYSGVFLTGNGEGAIAGNINLTLNSGQVFFQSTLFQFWTARARASNLSGNRKGWRLPLISAVERPALGNSENFLAQYRA